LIGTKVIILIRDSREKKKLIPWIKKGTGQINGEVVDSKHKRTGKREDWYMSATLRENLTTKEQIKGK